MSDQHEIEIQLLLRHPEVMRWLGLSEQEVARWPSEGEDEGDDLRGRAGGVGA